MRIKPVICVLVGVGALSTGASPMAEPLATTPSGAQAASQSEPTSLSGFDVVAPKKVTPVSGVDVVAKRATKVSELEVTVPLCAKAKTTREPAEDRFPSGNNIVPGD